MGVAEQLQQALAGARAEIAEQPNLLAKVRRLLRLLWIVAVRSKLFCLYRSFCTTDSDIPFHWRRYIH